MSEGILCLARCNSHHSCLSIKMRRRVIFTVAVTVLFILSYGIIIFRSFFNYVEDQSISVDYQKPADSEYDLTQNVRKSSHVSLSNHQSSLETLTQIRDKLRHRFFNDSESISDDEQQQHSTFRGFETCRMSTCFDYTNCHANKPLKVGITTFASGSDHTSSVQETTLIYKKILSIIKESRFFEQDPSEACVKILETDTLDRDPLSSNFRQNSAEIFNHDRRYGMNFLIFNLYSGTWPDYREDDFAGLQFGAAIMAKASNSLARHRPGFDISLPLFSHTHPCDESDVEPLNLTLGNRRYLVSFKGKRYVFGTGSETRNQLYHIDNNKDVLMLTTCRHGKRWQESSDDRCDTDESRYDSFDFDDLMSQSTFCLTPRGRRLGSFRFLESLAKGCIPVVLSDGWVWPFADVIDWSKAALQVEEAWLPQVVDYLREIEGPVIEEMRRNCIKLYERYFSTTKKIVLNALEIIEMRIQNRVRRFRLHE